MGKTHPALTPAQVAHLMELTSRGTSAVKTYRRSRALRLLHRGHSDSAVARQLQVC